MGVAGFKPITKGLLIGIPGLTQQYLGCNQETHTDPTQLPVFHYTSDIFERINGFRKQGIDARLFDFELDIVYGPQLVDCTEGFIKFGLITK